MSEIDRRTFIKRSAGIAGAAAVGAVAAQSSVAALASPRKKAEKAEHAEAQAGEPVVAYVRGGSRGEVTIMAGDRETVHRDPELVRRLLRAAK